MKKHLLLSTLCLCSILFAGGCATVDTDTPDTGYITDIPSPTPTFDQFATDIFLDEVTADTMSLH